MEFVDESDVTIEKAIKKALDKLQIDINSAKYVIIKKDPIVVRVYKRTEEIEKIEIFIKELFQKLGTKGKFQIIPKDKNTVYINIKTSNLDSVLIGKDGKVLEELNYLLNLILKKLFPKNFKFIFDINGYRKKKEEYIINKAIATAKLAIENKLEYTLDPLKGYEKKLVIEALKNIKGIRIEKVGKGKRAKLVIVPDVKWYHCFN